MLTPDHDTDHLLMDSPIGTLQIACDGERITGLAFKEAAVSGGIHRPVLREARDQIAAYFRGERRAFDLPLGITVTPFQRAVLSAVEEISWGCTASYQDIAEKVGGNAVARAVGSANGANPLPILVPCHRVVGSDGRLTGYIGGLWRKQWLLRHEWAIGADLFSS